VASTFVGGMFCGVTTGRSFTLCVILPEQYRRTSPATTSSRCFVEEGEVCASTPPEEEHVVPAVMAGGRRM
jgi:hypothetical protein